MSQIRSRKWFITVNKGAKCFDDIPGIISNQKNCTYYYILHDKDNEEQAHYHIVLNCFNQRYFTAIVDLFKGAHIEVPNYFNLSVQYLIHINEPNKYQYDKCEIITNDDEDGLNTLLNTLDFEKLDTSNLLSAISSGEVTNLTQACIKWGIGQVQSKRALINDLLREYITIKEKN